MSEYVNCFSNLKILLVVFSLFLISFVAAAQANTSSFIRITPYDLMQLVDVFEQKCVVSDGALRVEGLNDTEITTVREFCAKIKVEKYLILKDKFASLRYKKSDVDTSKITGYSNSYTCIYNGSKITAPNYYDLGLTVSKCSWHDAEPVACKKEGGVACLWGCTNTDPNLGWHTKKFSSKTVMETEIYKKGYNKVYPPWTAGYGSDYARQISYGFRYQVIWDGLKYAYSEGPEPNPEPNWYGFVNGFWPSMVNTWHGKC